MVGLKLDEGGFGLGEWVYSGFKMDLGLVQKGVRMGLGSPSKPFFPTLPCFFNPSSFLFNPPPVFLNPPPFFFNPSPLYF